MTLLVIEISARLVDGSFVLAVGDTNCPHTTLNLIIQAHVSLSEFLDELMKDPDEAQAATKEVN
jgi:hypothetical protein